MRPAALFACLLALFSALPARADGERAGEFDYYVMALSWNASWCALEGDGRGADQCDPRHDFGFTLHGLWPQYEEGWPSYCRGSAANPPRSMTSAMSDITGTQGLAWHAWNKHGRCSGLAARDYFELSRDAYEAVKRPDVLRSLKDPVTLPASVVEAAFLEANPGMTADMVTVTCRDGRIAEVRICLEKDLSPRQCGADTIGDCRMRDALFEPVR